MAKVPIEYGMQMWRNWQTRYFEVVVSILVWVQVPSSAPNADMAELADALDSGSSDFTVIQVQVLLSAPASTSSKKELVVFLFPKLNPR